ncbi:glycosyltransferase family 4 protein [Conexibacter sp. DBS9H8]|uniref:glycosyltransferase family 4 protein n=1 Tax=Conexibacter sp. DBS9H8 TaxID=2937801 RepID=UPI00200ECE21|nr:glycosyltransferase family 4 protein [Conexibacter sp. DBS9H8]
MRVLLLHNRYRAPGGEERAVAATADLLERRGHRALIWERDSTEIGRLDAARGLLVGGLDPAAVAAAVTDLGADVVHAHNLHPGFGWRALAAARAAGAATVLTLHNFRLFCATGVGYRDGAPCHLCRGVNTLPGLVHRCRGPLPEAVTYAAGLALQQRRLLAHTDRLISLSHAHRALLAGHGLPETRVSVVPHFLPDGAWAPRSVADAGSHALAAGRLVPEKGYDTAIRAAAGAGVPLTVAGDGPDRARLAELARRSGARVAFTGWLDAEALADQLRRAAVLLVPSRCEEAFGYGALDAFAAGVPVIASPRGGLAELVQAGGGTLVDPDLPGAWAEALRTLWQNPQERRHQGESARVATAGPYGEHAALSRLEGAYQAALERRRDRT